MSGEIQFVGYTDNVSIYDTVKLGKIFCVSSAKLTPTNAKYNFCNNPIEITATHGITRVSEYMGKLNNIPALTFNIMKIRK